MWRSQFSSQDQVGRLGLGARCICSRGGCCSQSIQVDMRLTHLDAQRAVQLLQLWGRQS
ncbi:GD21963 [Drosophila simulans]|uniref:GD21963 n=1 Tax=Drosophila simulans TaxID=7240 RepID=B4Q6D3_DROSI|nr:GD21963 [Drosophila simulans]